MRVVIVFTVCLVLAIGSVNCGEDPKPTGMSMGFRKWVGGKLGIISTTTTTTKKPNIIDRAQSYYREQKDRAKIILDPQAYVKKAIKDAVVGK